MNDDVRSLKHEVNQLRASLNQQLDDIEQRLDTAILNEMAQNKATGHIADTVPTNAQVNRPPTQKSAEPKLILAATADSQYAEQFVNPNTSKPTPAATIKPSKPSFIHQLLMLLAAMFADWFAPVLKIYQSYQQRNMAGIFIITIIGIVLTLSGVGYLMQLMIEQLGVGSKALLLCLVSVGVIGLGIYLKLKTRFAEFATAIVATGLLIAYTTVYFAGSVFYVIEQFTTLVFYLLIALSCHAFALWLNTKVLACLGIIGIATMPMISNTIDIHGITYFISLALVTLSTLIISYRLNWQWLASLCLAFVIIAIEFSIGVEQVQISNWLINGFYLMFFAYTAIAFYQSQSQQSKTLLMLIAAISSTLLMFYQSSEPAVGNINISLVLATLINTATALFLATLFYKTANEHSTTFILIAGAWGIVTVIALLAKAYWGIAWALEGLLLIYTGRRYIMPSVINQGQGLTFVALLYCFFAIAPYFPLPALRSLDGWILTTATVLVIAIWQRLIVANTSSTEKQRVTFNAFSLKTIKPSLQFIEVVWLTILAIVTLHMYIGPWVGVTVIAMQLLILLRAKQINHPAMEGFGAALIVVPLYFANMAAIEINSYRLTLLPEYAQGAIISAFLQLRLWSAFNSKVGNNSVLNAIAEYARILFYLLIPVVWLGSAVRALEQGISQVLWLSPLLAMLLAYKVQHWLLFIQAKFLTILAAVMMTGLIAVNSVAQALISFTGFSFLYVIAYLSKNNKRLTHPGRAHKQMNRLSVSICRVAVKTSGFALPIFIGVQFDSVLIASLTASVYWAAAYIFINKSIYLRTSSEFIKYTNLLILLASWFLTLGDSYYVCSATLTLAGMVYGTLRAVSPQKRLRIGKHYDLFLHSFAAITYCLALFSLAHSGLDLLIGPVLAIHGVYILLNQSGSLIKVKYGFALMLIAIVKLTLVDAASALLWQKVVLFIGVGAFLLFAAFWYQKLMTKMTIADTATNN
ncbi:hypothetical protein A9Q98_12915 [Thalassotalea sp. 42_200_T64]|nr:hypothetical protein A9Q98_12915 [Thalassotalea sp. 42_200_T64]